MKIASGLKFNQFFLGSCKNAKGAVKFSDSFSLNQIVNSDKDEIILFAV